ncbi:MAG: hypothetical protein ACJ8AG_03675, partial [Ktedonobacteraceae bacterium]
PVPGRPRRVPRPVPPPAVPSPTRRRRHGAWLGRRRPLARRGGTDRASVRPPAAGSARRRHPSALLGPASRPLEHASDVLVASSCCLYPGYG